MNQKHHVSQTIAKQLAEAGIVIESESQWEVGGKLSGKQNATLVLRNRPLSFVSADSAWSFYPAPIATELLEIMPAVLKVTDTGVGLNDYACLEIQKYCSGEKIYGVLYSLGEDIAYYKEVGLEEYSPTLPDALALLLIRLTKDGLI